MTDAAISGLTELAEAPAAGDLIVITDVSDTTQSANGTSKKNTVANFIASAVNQKTELKPQHRIPPLSGINAAGLSLVESTDAGTYKPAKHILSFDDSTDEGAMWEFRPPQAFTTATLKITYYMSGANTSKSVGWVAYIAAISDTDTSVTAFAFDSANTGTTTCPDAAGTEDEASITLTNADSLAVGDRAVILIRRNAAVANDATGDCNYTYGEIQYS